MAEFPAPIGKIDQHFFDEVIMPRLGARRSEVLIGPRMGVDVGVIRLPAGQVLAMTTDPLSVIPALGLEDSAWLSVHLLASDLATTGLPAAYAAIDFNLPPQMSAQEFHIYWEAMHREFERLNIAVVTGHTGRYVGCDYTIVGAGVLCAVGPEERYVSASMAQPGDQVLITKGAAIATTGLLSRVFPQTIRREFGDEVLSRAQDFFWKFSVVEEALLAVRVGVREAGVRAMHDATEGGVLGGLLELAGASSCGIRVQRQAIPIAEETKKICELFEIDPYWALSEGTLILAVVPEYVDAVRHELTKRGVVVAHVGELLPPSEGNWLIEPDGTPKRLTPLGQDPYWSGYWRAVQRGWT
ncbi:MAG: AIR synthase-related protein [Candidatus Bipolaricaulota bacterium]|nr:AIR synthase-related protein [Candidatus Bipolaricaulota bacterium]